MKVISLIEPWATLVVIGAKKVETRTKNTLHRGCILIHASTTFDPIQNEYEDLPYFNQSLNGHTLHKGVIIGKVSIDQTFKTKDAEAFFYKSEGFKEFADIKKEKAFGDYSPGRWGWELSEPVAFTNLIPFVGGVGFTKSFDERICLACGCTDNDCRACIEKTGKPCHWVSDHLCSACGFFPAS